MSMSYKGFEAEEEIIKGILIKNYPLYHKTNPIHQKATKAIVRELFIRNGQKKEC